MVDKPIACTLQPAHLTAQVEELLPGVARRASRRIPIDDGYRLQFDAGGEILTAIVRMIDAERKCCRFLRFTLIVESDDAIQLDVTGPSGTAAFLDDLFAKS